MNPPVCRLCRKAHWGRCVEFGGLIPAVALDRLRSSASSPSSHMPGKSTRRAPGYREALPSRPAADSGKPDIAPLLSLRDRLRVMGEEEFAASYNAHQA